MRLRTSLASALLLIVGAIPSLVGCESVDPNDDESEPVEQCTALPDGVVSSFFEQASDTKDLVVYRVEMGADHTVELQLFGEGDFPGLAPGSTFLGLEAESNYQTCSRCLLVGQKSSGKMFLADDGILELSTFQVGSTTGSITDMHFVEVTIDDETNLSTVVEGGDCLTLDALRFDTSKPPNGWECSAEQYTDSQCHCGCGLVDPWCDDETSSWCEVDTCAQGEVPNAANNAACVAG